MKQTRTECTCRYGPVTVGNHRPLGGVGSSSTQVPQLSVELWCAIGIIVFNYPPKGRWKVVDIYRDAKRRGIYSPLFTDPEEDSCFSMYQIRWIEKRFFNFFFWSFRETARHFPLRSQNGEYPRIFRVTGANQNARKLLSTDLVNTKYLYSLRRVSHW